MIDRKALESRFTHSEWAKFHLPWLITNLEGRLCFVLPEQCIGPALRSIEAEYKKIFRLK